MSTQFVAASIDEQYALAQTDDVRTLVVGAGIAGITTAQLLRRSGRHPVLAERAPNAGHPGYMLALMPMVDQAFQDLGVTERYRANSVPLERYGFHGHTGRRMREDSMSSILDRFGDYRGIGRGELIDVLTTGGCDLSYDTTVTRLIDTGSAANVTLATPAGPRQLEFDLVVIADGIHSSTRELVLGDQPIDIVDTSWGGWVVWAPEDADTDRGDELWGAGFFLGTYPVKGRIGVFLGGPVKETRVGAAAFVNNVRKKLTTTSPRFDHALTAVTEDPDAYFWPLTDCRSPQWAIGRTVLVGDAAAGFLPTAGIGAAMAIESAWVLSRMLRDATRENLPKVLQAFERDQRPRVEAAQATSRTLARVMFRSSRPLAAIRDLAMRFVSVTFALKPIQRLLIDKPNPTATAALEFGFRRVSHRWPGAR